MALLGSSYEGLAIFPLRYPARVAVTKTPSKTLAKAGGRLCSVAVLSWFGVLAGSDPFSSVEAFLVCLTGDFPGERGGLFLFSCCRFDPLIVI